MTIIYALAIVGAVTIFMSPVIYIWCIRENKSLRDGLRDWLDDE